MADSDYDSDSSDTSLDVFEVVTSDQAVVTTEPSWMALYPAQFSMDRRSKEDHPTIEDQAHFHNTIYRDFPILSTKNDDLYGHRIRLLQIKPDTLAQPICCNLIVRPVFDAPEYIALSYSWGQGMASNSIFVGREKTPYSVSAHLWAALQALRKEQETVSVWVDAICIDQHNYVEKAQQVQIMAQIFNQADEVRIWLGALDGLDSISDTELFWSLSQQRDPWWSRLWIVQECAYARTCPMVMLGSMRVSLETLIDRWTSVLESEAHSASERLKLLKENLEFLRVPYEIWQKQAKHNVHQVPLLQRLRETAGRQCTDPRDKVYAILSLVIEAEAVQILPDYRKSYSQLRLEIRKMLKQSPNYDPMKDTSLLGLPVEPEMQRALEEASRAGELKAVEALIEDVAFGGSFDNTNALQASSIGGHTRIVNLLLGHGADVNAQGGHYGNALSAASLRGSLEIVRILLKHGADVHAQGGHYGNALSAASSSGSLEVVRTLLEHGADVHAQGGYYGNALSAASLSGSLEIVMILLEHGADVHAQGGHYSNALSAASLSGSLEIVTILLEHGADVHAQGGHYSNAVSAASANGYTAVTRPLLQHGADVNA